MKNTFDPSNLYYILQICASAIAGILTIYKLIPKIYIYFKNSRSKNTELHSKIDVIFRELIPNHGSSLKDKVSKIETCLNENTSLTSKIFYRQRWILDNQDIPIFESDSEGKCVWVNTKYRELFNRDMSYFLGNGWKSAIHIDDRERVVSEWENCVKDGRTSENTYRMIDSENNIHNVRSIASRADSSGYVGSLKIL